MCSGDKRENVRLEAIVADQALENRALREGVPGGRVLIRVKA